MFSPRYFAARTKGQGHAALDHCGVNAVLYHRKQGRWVMTMVPQGKVQRSGEHLHISGSTVAREGDRLIVELNEATAPFGRAFRGRVELELLGGLSQPRALDSNQDHAWWPVGAVARAQVRLDAPEICFSGSGYHDCNFGQVPLEHTFERWTWSRAELGEGVGILYDTVEKDGKGSELGLLIKSDAVESLQASRRTSLGKGRWGMGDETRSDPECMPPRLLQRLEDTPFYNRSLLETSLHGQRCVAVHESLSLERFARGWVQFLLPFRMRR